MGANASSRTSDAASIVSGVPLSAEPGLGALTIPGYLQQVTTRFAEREALVQRTAQGALRWTYATLWERSVEVARALAACGVGKDSRVGVLMTNRPEHLAAAFGTALAGGVIVPLNTFATPPELQQLLDASSVSILFFERRILKKDFAAILGELEPAIQTAEPGRLLSNRFPFLRSLVRLDTTTESADERAIESWPDFLRRGSATPSALVAARAATVMPADAGALFFSSGTTNKPKGILHSQRAVAIQWWRWRRLMGVGDDVRSWTANGFFWSGNFSMVIGSTLSSGGAIVLQPTFQAEEALDLMQKERVTMPFAWPHQWAKLEEASNWNTVDLSSLRYVDDSSPLARHPTVETAWQLPSSYGTTETLTINTSFPSSTPSDMKGSSHGEPLPGNTLKIVDPVTGGANVAPREVDAVLAAHRGVRLTQTVGVPHETLGEMVVSCIVPHEGVVLDEMSIRDFAKTHLASYKVPRRVVFVRDEELSMTGSDKVKADALRQLAAERLGAAR